MGQIAKWIYECVVSTCGYVEPAKYAPAATKRCPSCGGMLVRKEA
jgi:rRNA maturation endonuclease Nob1